MRIVQLDGALLDTDGVAVASAPENIIASRDATPAPCLRLSVTVPAGQHYFGVGHPDQSDVPAYTLNAIIAPIVDDGDLCDAAGDFLVCDEGLSCITEGEAIDGECGVASQPVD